MNCSCIFYYILELILHLFSCTLTTPCYRRTATCYRADHLFILSRLQRNTLSTILLFKYSF